MKQAIIAAVLTFALSASAYAAPLYESQQCAQLRMNAMLLKGQHVDRTKGQVNAFDSIRVTAARAQADKLRQANPTCFSKLRGPYWR